MVVDTWLERAAASAPAAIAVQTPVAACSYAELLERARVGAGELAARGAAPGERVAIALPAGLDFVCALHACLLLGAVAVPVDLRLGERERAAIVDGAAVVVDEPLRAAGARGVPTGVQGASAGAAHDLDAVAAVIHTSGTTSAPKPVELTYGNFLWSALGSAVALGLDPHERWLCNLPLSHVGGLSILLRSAIYATTAIVHERFDTELTLRAVMGEAGGGVHLFEPPTNRTKVAASPVARVPSAAPATLVSLVATTLTRLLDAGLERPPALRCALTGGGPVPAALLERARAAGVPVSLTYGMTETCSQVTTLPPKPGDTRLRRWPIRGCERSECPPNRSPFRPAAIDGDSAAPATAGPPLFCTHVRTAADGEIEVAGPTLARGVAGGDGWLRTGDVGRLNGEGNLSVTGRKADTIVSGGENVAPTEVEAVLEEHPCVLEAAAIGRADERWGEAVTALVVVRNGAKLHGEELRVHCAARLAPYKVPKEVALVEGPLPRTRSGKLLRRELR
jgi:O-succinylbenzoic acid--CoA ligase